ncbi:MAG: DUF5360 family protein [Myxococcota bacterium]
MPRSLVVALTVTDFAFLAYWLVAALSQLGFLEIPPSWMYANYDRPDVIAWNWSFLPMDLAFSYFGLRAVAAGRHGDVRWRGLAIVSLTLTMAAGGMAVSYWILKSEYEPTWFVSNALLVIWPLFFLPRLLAEPTSTDLASLAPVDSLALSDPPAAPTPSDEILDRYLRAHANNNLDEVLSLFATDATLEDPVGTPPLRGAESIRAFYAKTHKTNGPLRIERIGPVLLGGDEQAAHVRAGFANQPPSTGMDVIYAVRLDGDNQIASLRAFY